MKTCHKIKECGCLEYLNCPIYQAKTNCWLRKNGCLCGSGSTVECSRCEIYAHHHGEVMELLERARNNDGIAVEELIKEYSGFIYKIAGKFYLPGGTDEDLYQEGLIGLYQAIVKYDPKLSDSFEKYASLCIRNYILASIKKATQKRQKALNEAENLVDYLQVNGSFLNGGINDVEDSAITNLTFDDIISNSSGYLSAVEYKVLVAKICGYSSPEIRKMYRLNEKQVENAIFRARNKIKEMVM